MKENKEHLRQRIGDLAYTITQEKGTEKPFSSNFSEVWVDAKYHCIVCNNELFESEHQFNAGCGWPSFDQPTANKVLERRDVSHGMIRVEVICGKCEAHLGHVFEDGPVQTTGLRYCINGAALKAETPDK